MICHTLLGAGWSRTGYSVPAMRRAVVRAFPRQSFLNAVDCPHCSRSYFVAGSAPIAEGHGPYYFACECGRRIMAVVPAGAEVRSVQPSWLSREKRQSPEND